MSGCDSRQPHQLPQAARQLAQQNLQNSVGLGSTEAACQFQMGAWQKSDAPALQAGLNRSVTGRPPPFHCGENEIQASLINSASVGATPTILNKFLCGARC